jgi:hypothetical protein
VLPSDAITWKFIVGEFLSPACHRVSGMIPFSGADRHGGGYAASDQRASGHCAVRTLCHSLSTVAIATISVALTKLLRLQAMHSLVVSSSSQTALRKPSSVNAWRRWGRENG